MALYLDSADLDHARWAKAAGGIRGLTTNPLLLREVDDIAARLSQLGGLGFERVYYQLRAREDAGLDREAARAAEILGERLVLKLAPTEAGYRACERLAARHPCCITAVFTPAQALRAKECGADQVAVYLHRASQHLGDGPGLLRQIAQVLEGSPTRVLAASLKSAEEAGVAALAGAHDLTLSHAVLSSMHEHPLSREALLQFDREGRGLPLDPA